MRILLALGAVLLAAGGAVRADTPQTPEVISIKAVPVLGHWMTAISVADLDAETAFFKKLGFTVEKDTTFGPGIPVRWLVSGDERIELLQIPDSKPPSDPRAKPPAHAAIQGISQITLSTSDIETTKAALATLGLTPAMDVTEVAPLGVKVMYFQDPEGNAIEIAQKL